MAAPQTPSVYGPDGVLRQALTFSTSSPDRFLTGVVDSATVDVEVSIRGSEYTRDPDLISFNGTSWTLPNPAAYPSGLSLDAGENVILLRAVSTTGEVSAPVTISIRSVRDSDISLVAEAPAGVSIVQLNGAVNVVVISPQNAEHLQGINFYASTEPGGGVSGYSKLNVQIVSSPTSQEVLEELTSLVVQESIPDVGSPSTTITLSGDVGGSEMFSEAVTVDQGSGVVRFTTVIEAVSQQLTFTFTHSRSATPRSIPATIFSGAFSSTPPSEPLYYVTSATYYDPITAVEVESQYSQEVVGKPVVVTTVPSTFPLVSRRRIVEDTTLSVMRSNPQARVDPGSVLRDVFIDPFASEAERIRFLIDFMHRCQSFSGILSVDDPSNTGSSSPVGTTPYKQALKSALFLTRDSDVQAIIDQAMETLAGNFGVSRSEGTFSRGEVTFFTTRRPGRTILIPLGTTVSGGGSTFKVLSSSSLSEYLDPATKRYQVTVPVQATQVGSSGDVAAGQVRRVVSGVSGLSVINASEIFGGKNRDSNAQLANMAQSALASVDSGTEQGYLQTASKTANVLKAEVVAAGQALMMRDLDPSGVHRGGKVDVWIQGENIATFSESFSFMRDEARSVHFVITGDPADLVFRAIDPDLSTSEPIVELIDNFVNATTGQPFDITDAIIQSYDTVVLSKDVPQPAVSFADVVFGDYYRRTGNTFTFSRQPVRSITSIVGALSGTLDPSTYRIVRTSDPLSFGRSTLAGDYVEILSYTSPGAISVTNEEHVLTGEYQERLDNRGVAVLTIVVRSDDGLTTYRGPTSTDGDPDYTVIDGSNVVAPALVRLPTGRIASGQTVLVDYEHDENFTVTYKTNALMQVVQSNIDVRKHATADVVVKEAVGIPISIAATIVMMPNANPSTVNDSVRTNLTNFFRAKRIGDPVWQSDIVDVIKDTPGVSYVIIPFTKMVRETGSLVVRESLTTDQASDVVYLSSWSSGSVSVWLISQEFTSATTTTGGPGDDFRGVFEDDLLMDLVTSSPATVMRISPNQAYFTGADGVQVDGLSDDVTLTSQGYTTSSARTSRRRALTANRVIVSTSVDDVPVNHEYAVTYVVSDDSGVKNIEVGAVSYPTLGSLDFTFDDDKKKVSS